jgi:hypothetical protein
MKNRKWLVACMALTVALLSASASYGQVTVMNGVGSSAIFPSAGLSAVTTDPVTLAPALCGSNLWTGGSGSPSSIATGVDSRGGGIHPEPGNLWVAWDHDTLPALTKVCTYLSVDSVVGDRLFLEQGAPGAGNGTLSLAASAKWTLGANKIAFGLDNTSCATSVGALTFPSIDLTLGSGTTLTATVHGGGNFSNYFANGAVITVTGSTAPNNVTNVKISGVTALGPTSFTFSGGAGASSDLTGGASVTVVANCPGLPADVWNALVANPHFTVAFTDIRPEDGLFAYHRANDATGYPSADDSFMSYLGKGILSSYSTAVAFPVNFGLGGTTDPISGQPVPATVTQSIAADPVVIVASRNNVTACGLGNAAFTSVTSEGLGRAYAGLAGATQDLAPALQSSAAGCPAPVWPVEREPLSGTFNTFEWQVIRDNNNRTRSQENGNFGYPQSNNNAAACGAWVGALTSTTVAAFPPAVAPPQHFDANNCGNPLNIQVATSGFASAAGPYSGFGGNRTRAIGTGEMVAVVNGGAGTKDSVGYAFYSLGTFGGKSGLKYVMLDNADPLYPSYVDNTLPGQVAPVCTGFVNAAPAFSCPTPQPTFDGLIGGGYRTWSVLRAVYNAPASGCPAPFTALTIGCLIQAAQDQAANNVKDFVPVITCGPAGSGTCTPTQTFKFFRSHYQNSGVVPHNGNSGFGSPCAPGTVPAEAGGDMAGAILPIQADYTVQASGCTGELTNIFQ